MDEKLKSKVLLAEPDHYIHRAVKEALSEADFDVISARTGDEAISKIRSENPDVVLLDLMLPIKNGFEVLEETQTDENFSHIPVLIYSNLSQESDIQKAKNLGAADYLIKTDISMKEIVGKIREHLIKSKLKLKNRR